MSIRYLSKKVVRLSTFLIACTAAFILPTSCDKMPENGELDGMWQVLDVSYNNNGEYDSIVAMKDKQLYWNVQLKLVSIHRGNGFLLNPDDQNPDKELNEYELIARLNYKGNILSLPQIYKHTRYTDELITDENTQVLQFMGIDGNKATFTVEHLNDKRLQISSDYARITFRRF